MIMHKSGAMLRQTAHAPNASLRVAAPPERRKQAAKKYLARNCVPKDTVPFEVPHCLRRR